MLLCVYYYNFYCGTVHNYEYLTEILIVSASPGGLSRDAALDISARCVNSVNASNCNSSSFLPLPSAVPSPGDVPSRCAFAARLAREASSLGFRLLDGEEETGCVRLLYGEEEEVRDVLVFLVGRALAGGEAIDADNPGGDDKASVKVSAAATKSNYFARLLRTTALRYKFSQYLSS